MPVIDLRKVPYMTREQYFEMIHQFSGQNNTLYIPILYIQLTKNKDAALLLNQLVYWTPKARDKEGWIFKTTKKWMSELYMTEHEFNKARKILEKDLGVIETCLRKANGSPVVHYRLKVEEFIDAISAVVGNGSPESQENDFHESPKTIITITTNNNHLQNKDINNKDINNKDINISDCVTETEEDMQNNLFNLPTVQEGKPAHVEKIAYAQSTADWSRVTNTDFLMYFIDRTECLKEKTEVLGRREVSYDVGNFKKSFLNQFKLKGPEVLEAIDKFVENYPHASDPKYKDRINLHIFTMPGLVKQIMEYVKPFQPSNKKISDEVF